MAKANKTTVVSFRITKKQADSLAKTLKEKPPVGVKTTAQLARKIVCDKISGRLAYGNPEDELIDRELVEA